MGDSAVLQEILKTLGPWGLIALLSWYLLTRMIPKMLDRFHTEQAEAWKKLDSLSDNMNEGFKTILHALNQNVMAVRFLIAKLTNVDIQHADMSTLICPHDGRPCSDPQKQTEHKEKLHGADTRRGQAPAETLGPHK